MTEVLEFPTREAQAFAFLERELTALLTARGPMMRSLPTVWEH